MKKPIAEAMGLDLHAMGGAEAVIPKAQELCKIFIPKCQH